VPVGRRGGGKCRGKKGLPRKGRNAFIALAFKATKKKLSRERVLNGKRRARGKGENLEEGWIGRKEKEKKLYLGDSVLAQEKLPNTKIFTPQAMRGKG